MYYIYKTEYDSYYISRHYISYDDKEDTDQYDELICEAESIDDLPRVLDSIHFTDDRYDSDLEYFVSCLADSMND